MRNARESDLDGIVALCAEHAEYEHASFDPDAARQNLGRFLFAGQPRAWCIVAEVGGELAGYAAYSLEFSTWRAAEYLHMDCLFVRAAHRNGGLGRLLLDAIIEVATAHGCASIEWQTPAWNTDAIRFYDRLGAIGSPKVRYRLATDRSVRATHGGAV